MRENFDLFQTEVPKVFPFLGVCSLSPGLTTITDKFCVFAYDIDETYWLKEKDIRKIINTVQGLHLYMVIRNKHWKGEHKEYKCFNYPYCGVEYTAAFNVAEDGICRRIWFMIHEDDMALIDYVKGDLRKKSNDDSWELPVLLDPEGFYQIVGYTGDLHTMDSYWPEDEIPGEEPYDACPYMEHW